MSKIIKKLAAIVMAASMVFAMGATCFAAEPAQNVNATLYKTGTNTLSMGNPAFVKGGTLSYNYDAQGNVTSTHVVLDVTSVTYMWVITGYMTTLNVDGTQLVPSARDSSGNILQFTGDVSGKLELGQRYVATVNIGVAGFMMPDTKGDLVFTAK